MKVKRYDEFVNEEINVKKALIGTAAVGVVGLSAYNTYKNYDIARFDKVETISSNKFKKYDLLANGNSFDLIISEDFVISSHWTEEESDGEDEDGNTKYKTVHYYNITIPNQKITEIYVDKKFMGGLFASSKQFSGSTKIKLNDLHVVEDTQTYTIYGGGIFGVVDYIVVNKGHKEGEEFTMDDDNLKTNYICDHIGADVYLIGFGPGGNFGGGGAGSEY